MLYLKAILYSPSYIGAVHPVIALTVAFGYPLVRRWDCVLLMIVPGALLCDALGNVGAYSPLLYSMEYLQQLGKLVEIER